MKQPPFASPGRPFASLARVRHSPLRPRLQFSRHRRVHPRPGRKIERAPIFAVVISNVAGAAGLSAAERLGLPHAVLESKGRKREEHDADVIASLHVHKVDLVCLAGYMRLLSPQFVAAFPNRILNIHPSLLPAFPGLEAQEQAFAYGAKITGCTVHFVDEELRSRRHYRAARDSSARFRRRTFARRADSCRRTPGLHRSDSRA